MSDAREHEKSTTVSDWLQRVRLWFRYHAMAYVAGNGLLILLNAATSDRWWAFWPFFFWSLFFACHFFLVKSMRADDDWAENRAMRLRSKSYDVDHIRAIERSYTTGTMPGQHDLNIKPDDETNP